MSNSFGDILDRMAVRPEYQQLIDEAEEMLPASHSDALRDKLERLSEYRDISEQFHNRGGKTIAEAKEKLSKKYHTSESNIERIAYNF